MCLKENIIVTPHQNSLAMMILMRVHKIFFSFEKYRKLSLNYPCYPYLHVSGARGHNIQSPRAKILKHCPWSFIWMCSLRFNPAVLSANVNSKNLIKFELLYIWLSILQGGFINKKKGVFSTSWWSVGLQALHKRFKFTHMGNDNSY